MQTKRRVHVASLAHSSTPLPPPRARDGLQSISTSTTSTTTARRLLVGCVLSSGLAFLDDALRGQRFEGVVHLEGAEGVLARVHHVPVKRGRTR